MFEGLFIYEIILLILGVVLFLLLLMVLIFFVIKKRPIKSIIPLFLVSIIMIAYPSIQKITFENGMFEIEKLTQEAEQNPDNPQYRRRLERKLNNIENRRFNKPETLKKLINANTILDRPQRVQALQEQLNSLPQ